MKTRTLLLALSLLAFAFAAPAAHAEGSAAPVAAAAPVAPPAEAPPVPAAAVAKPAARREDVEPKTLTAALDSLKEARTDRDRAEGELGTESASHDKTKALLADTLALLKTAKADLAASEQLHSETSRQLADEQNAHGKSKELLTLAESALQVSGIPSASAVPIPAESKEESKVKTRADFAQLSASEKSDFCLKGGRLVD